MGLDVDVDRDVCMGSGNCVGEAPDAFDLDADGIAVVVDASAVSEDTIIAVAQKCPSHAISVRRDGSAVV